MYARQITSEETYTLTEAKRIIETERKAKRKKILYYTKQKLLGVVALLTVIAEFTMAHFGLIDEGGAFIILLPLGLDLLFTKKKVIYWKAITQILFIWDLSHQ